MKGKRYQLLDTIRGIVLVSMIVYHATWNFVYIYGMDWDWYRSKGAYVWQQSICWTFILLSGFCFSLGKRHLKSGLMVFGGGLLVTLVTLLVMPSNRVIFGVLTCIGSCILLLNFTERFLRKLPCEMGAMVNFLIFLFTKNINNGYLGFGNIRVLEIPTDWYHDYLTTYLGFPFREFYSTDYFSLLPWVFLFITGFYLCQIFKKYGFLQKSFMTREIPLFTLLGKNSLWIYLIHQPVIYGLQEIFF